MGDDNSFTSSPPSSKYIPSFIDGTPIVHDNNRGSIAGTIHEFDLWKLRTGVFIEYSELHGVIYKSRTADGSSQSPGDTSNLMYSLCIAV